MKTRKNATTIRELLNRACLLQPFVFTSAGGSVREAKRFLAQLALKLSEKKQLEYSIVIHWLRAKLSFNLLRSAVLCVWGSGQSGTSWTMMLSAQKSQIWLVRLIRHVVIFLKSIIWNILNPSPGFLTFWNIFLSMNCNFNFYRGCDLLLDSILIKFPKKNVKTTLTRDRMAKQQSND